MAPSGAEGLEQRLRSLREQQARLAVAGQGDSAQMQKIERGIAAVASQPGFDRGETAAIVEQIDAPASGPGHGMAGEYRVLRGAAEPILTFSALVIAGAVAGLGQPVVGAAIVFAAVASCLVRSARRVARFRIEDSGALSFPGRLDRFDPSELLSMDFAYRYPFGVAEHGKAASETIDLRLRLTGGRSIKLARGPLWRTAPRREPVAYHRLEKFLSAIARAGGLRVERAGAGWTARRP